MQVIAGVPTSVKTTVAAVAASAGGGGISQRHLTSNYVMIATDNNVYFDNLGALAEVDVTLPALPESAQLNTFIVVAGQNLMVVAPAGVTIDYGVESSAVGGNIVSSLPGSSVTLYAVSATLWVSTSTMGSWALN